MRRRRLDADRRVSARCCTSAMSSGAISIAALSRTISVVEAYYLQRARFESIAERKLRRRQLTEDGNVEISGRDLG